MLRRLCTFAIAVFVVASPVAAETPSFDREAWLADYERLKLGLAQGYANLDWQVERRGISLARADAQITAMLQKATSEAEAMLALTKLVEIFRDPHLQFHPGPPPTSAQLLPTMSTNRAFPMACDDIEEPRAATRLPYSKAPGWQPVAGAPFPSGLVGRTGFLRVPSFDEERYAPACTKSGEEGSYERRLALRAALNQLLLKRIATLKALGMERLVIDLSGNGGGSEWSSELAGLLVIGTLERPAPRMVAPVCDRSGVWRGEEVCSSYASASTETMQGKGAWAGPIAVITDRHTASAAEEFVSWLRENGRAKIVGERTFGAGCGYVDGGTAIAFGAAPVHLMVPNCSRYTKTGLNEVEGLMPDVAIDWGLSDPEDALAVVADAFDK